ncbi:uncharacterized protein LOC127800219 isoform X2 [Diospyros lotus]|uniref:uncharacterized protein LOC127800219 isoform X2 n=1 Tax=Diospyros lotus TaxID=55363 RepID=UPI00225B0833|nr:uncharacterized protein LOC127800219 isoform X2 [Diospyros lotus]
MLVGKRFRQWLKLFRSGEITWSRILRNWKVLKYRSRCYGLHLLYAYLAFKTRELSIFSSTLAHTMEQMWKALVRSKIQSLYAAIFWTRLSGSRDSRLTGRS